MGNSGSSLQPVLAQRQTLQCDGNGVAKFRRVTVNGQPANPGFYKIICNVNINEAEVRGIMVNGQITPRGFVAVKYVDAEVPHSFFPKAVSLFCRIP
jgi:hypothetical protein